MRFHIGMDGVQVHTFLHPEDLLGRFVPNLETNHFISRLSGLKCNIVDQRCPTGGPRCLLQSPPFLPTFRRILQIFPYHASRFLPQVLFAP